MNTRGRVRRYITALTSLIMFLTALNGHAQSPIGDWVPVSAEVPLDMVVDTGRDLTHHVVTARVTGLSELEALKSEELASALQSTVRPDVLAQVTGQDWVDTDILEEIGLPVGFNAQELNLHVSVRPSVQPIQEIRINGNTRLPSYPVREPAALSLVLPVNLYGETSSLKNNSLQALAENATFGFEVKPRLSVFGWLAEGRLKWQSTTADPLDIESWEGRVVRDNLRNELRWTAGDLTMPSRGFQGSDRISGISLEKRSDIGFGRDVPSRYVQKVEITDRSTAEIVVNGRTVRTETLQPGNYELSDFPLVPGTNRVEIRIIDSYGDVRTLNGTVSYAAELLHQGSAAYGISAGIRDREIDDPLMRGFFRYGLASALTLESYVEADMESQLAGGGILAAGLNGVYDLTGAVSTHSGTDTGFAVRMNYAVPNTGNSWVPGFALYGQYRSALFAPPGGTALDVDSYSFGGSLNQALPFRSSLLVGGTYRATGGGASYATVYAGLAKQLGAATSLRVNASVQQSAEGDTWSASISLVSRPNSGTTSVGTTYDVDRNRLDSGAAYNYTGGSSSGTLGVLVSSIDPERGTFQNTSGSLRNTSTRLDSFLGASATFDTTDGTGISSSGVHYDPEEFRMTARLGSALYFADGLASIGRPSSGSFVLIGKEEGISQGDVLVNPSGGDPESSTGSLGAALITGLPSYSARPLQTEVVGIPVDYALGPTSFVVQSGYQTGTAIRIQGEPLVYGSGHLFDANGDSLPLQVFELVPADGTRKTPVLAFTDEHGWFTAYELRPGRYDVRLPDGTASATITVSDTASSPINLGDITLTGGSQ